MIGHKLIGQGPRKVIVLHGWFGDHSVWAPAYRYIDEDQFCFAFLDIRGYGASRGMPGERSMRRISLDAIELADQLGWDEFSVVGHSMGGQAAQRLAVDAPQRVRALVGVTPVPASGMQMPPEVKAVFARAAEDDEAGLQILTASLGNRLKPEVATTILRSARETADRAAFRDYGHAFIETNFADEVHAIKAPILVLVGEHDGGVTEEFVRQVFPPLYPHVEIELIPNSGHYPMIETPAWLMTRIERFLAECAR